MNATLENVGSGLDFNCITVGRVFGACDCACMCVAWAGESAAVYLAAYLLVCWVNAAADCCGGVCLHVVSGFPTLCGYYRLTSAWVCAGSARVTTDETVTNDSWVFCGCAEKRNAVRSEIRSEYRFSEDLLSNLTPQLSLDQLVEDIIC